MIKKLFKTTIIRMMMACFVLVLVACGGGNETTSTPAYTITWEVNGTIVETDSNVEEGTMPNYDGTIPVKNDVQYEFTFSGWTPELTAVTQNQKYTAVFTQGEIKEYTITWKDADNTVLETTEVAYGAVPKYTLPSDTIEWDYTGWTPSLVAVTGDVVYTAVRELQEYTITWKDVDNTVLGTTEVAYGAVPKYTLPSDTIEWDYTGWTPSLVAVTGDVTYTAVREKKEYTITWQDADNSILGTTTVVYGTMPTYNLPEDTERWDYTEWTPSVVTATGNATYTAVREDKKYKINNQVLVDNDNLNITIINVYEDDIFGFTVSIYYENKTSNKELMFALGDTVVNGYLINSLWVDSLAAGEKATDTIYVSSSDLNQLGIVWVDKIEMYIRVYDNDGWLADDLINTKYVLYPTGLSENDVVSPDRPISSNEVTLVDDEYLTFIIIDTYVDNIWGYTLKVYLENKTTDKEIMYSLNDIIINGYKINALWAKSLPSETKALSEIQLSSTDMEASGITTVDKIEIYTRIYDNNDWFADEFINDKFTIYPTGLSEGEIVSPSRPSNETEYIVFDNEEVTFIIIETYDDRIWGYSVKIYLENKTDKELMFTWDDVSVNGYSIDPYWATTLMPRSKSVDSISFFESDFEENNIKVVNEIGFTLRIYDTNDWLAEDLVNDIFSYNP